MHQLYTFLGLSMSLELSPSNLAVIVLGTALLTVLAILPAAFRNQTTTVDTNSTSPTSMLMLLVAIIVVGSLLFHAWSNDQTEAPEQDKYMPSEPSQVIEPDTDVQRVHSGFLIDSSFKSSAPTKLPVLKIQSAYVWQVGSFSAKANALRCQSDFQHRGFMVEIEAEADAYKVYLLPDADINSIDSIKAWARRQNVYRNGHFVRRHSSQLEIAVTL